MPFKILLWDFEKIYNLYFKIGGRPVINGCDFALGTILTLAANDMIARKTYFGLSIVLDVAWAA